MTVTLAIHGGALTSLLDALGLDVESAWTATARIALDGRLMLAASVDPIADSAYIERSRLRLQIRSTGFMPAFAAAADDPQAIPVFIHTHPGGRPTPSELDQVVDQELLALALMRVGRADYMSVIIGGEPQDPHVTGRIWRDGTAQALRLDRVRVAGPQMRVILADDRDPGSRPSAMFDRNVRAFGEDGQRLLHALTIGVVGAGGTGSPTIEQLARLGVGRVLVIDDDTIDATNLTRIHQSVVGDVGRPKVDAARDSGQAYGTGTIVDTIKGKAVTAPTILRLAACDVIFGCTDDHAGRMVISKLAYHYLVPVIDCGVKIDATDGEISGIFGRITVVAPGTACLVCRREVDLSIAAAELLDPAERERREAEGYVPLIGDHAPAVVSFTTAVSALAVNELLARLFGYGATPYPSQLLVRFHERDIRATSAVPSAGHYCGNRTQWGLGDTRQPLNLGGIN